MQSDPKYPHNFGSSLIAVKI